MSKYEFSLVLKGPLELSEEIADKLYECGCDDGSPGTCNGVFSIDFHREASSLEAAINSAIQNVRDAGITIFKMPLTQISRLTIPAPDERIWVR